MRAARPARRHGGRRLAPRIFVAPKPPRHLADRLAAALARRLGCVLDEDRTGVLCCYPPPTPDGRAAFLDRAPLRVRPRSRPRR